MPSASATNLGLDGGFSAVLGDEEGAGVGEEEDAAASGVGEKTAGSAASSSGASAPAASLTSLWKK